MTPNYRTASPLGKITLGLIIVVASLIASIIYSYFTLKQLYNNFAWVEHTYNVKEELKEATASLSQCEQACSDFFYTHEASLKKSYNNSSKILLRHINKLKTLTDDNSLQHKRVAELEWNIQKLTSFLETSFTDSINNRNPTRLAKASYYIENINKLVLLMQNEEGSLLQNRQQQAYTNLSYTTKTLVVATVISLAIIVFVILLLRKDLTERIKLEKDLRTLDTNKNKFFSIMSHDLRGPVHGIAQLATYLDENASPEETAEMGKAIKNAADKTGDLLEKLLLWSKVQTGNYPIKQEVINLCDIINSVVADLEDIAASKKITITCTSENIFVKADKKLITFVLRNVIENAIKFSYEESVVTVLCNSEKQNKTEIRITDSGIGMSEELINNVFHIQHAHARKGTKGEKGSGISLVLCKDFIELNGGEAYIESGAGKGTVFCFSLICN